MTPVLVVGAGGLSCPAASVLARSGVELTVLDDDVVDESNLHRQTLFEVADVGQPKAEVAARRLSALGASCRARVERLLPENAADLLAGHALVIEGADNFATKFLAFDAARLAGVPVVQGGAVRWQGWATSSPSSGGPCFRCLFEDVPETADACDVLGVVGPVVGVVGALMAALALRVLGGNAPFGTIDTHDALTGRLRRVRFAARPDCDSCRGSISDLRRERYAPSCAA